MKNILLYLCTTLLIMTFPITSQADWVNLTGAENSRNIAEIFINDDHVKVQLEIFIRDVPFFDELVPDSFFTNPPKDRLSASERMKTFAENTFKIVSGNGEYLRARLDIIEPRTRISRQSSFAGTINPYTGKPIPGAPEDKRVLYAELTYLFEEKPQTLTIIPPLDQKGFPAVEIGFLCYHNEVPVVDFRYLTASNTVSLDWDDPWYSVFHEKRLKRALQAGVRTFLYIEPYEVRHEILVRVKDMMAWIDFDLRGDQHVEEDEFNPVREQVASFFMEREKLLIDNKEGKPILDRTAFVESSMLRSRFIEIPERIPLNTAMIGIVITYLTDGIPDTVETRWDLFSDRVQKVTARMTDPAGPFPYDLTPSGNVLKWENYLKNYTIPTVQKLTVDEKHRGIEVPLVSLICVMLLFPLTFMVIRRSRKGQPIIVQLVLIVGFAAGAVMLTPLYQFSFGNFARASQVTGDDGKAIVLSLLSNIYRAFDFREEGDIYDKLSVSVSGDLLRTIYLENRKSMVIEQAGGAQAKVKKVQVLAADAMESRKHKGAMDVKAKWTALGQVGHWGHTHTRQNVYEAYLTLAVVDGNWKIIDIELLEERRLKPKLAIQGTTTSAL